MKKRIVYIMLMMYIFTTILSCRKDKVPVMEEENCSCNWSQFIGDYQYESAQNGNPDSYSSYSDTFLLFPHFNPNNPNEIAFIDAESSTDKIGKLYVYNILTGLKTLIHDGIITDFTWSKKDWIVFQDAQQNYVGKLYKVKSNGDSLQELTPVAGIYFHPEWNYNGDKLLVFDKYATFIEKSKIMNENGQIIDTITGIYHTNGDWFHPNFYVGKGAENLYTKIDIFDVANQHSFFNLSLPLEPSYKELRNPSWIATNKFIYNYGGEMMVFNLANYSSESFACQCGFYYGKARTTSDYSKWIYSKTFLSKDEESNNFKTKYISKIYISDPYFKNEVELVIP